MARHNSKKLNTMEQFNTRTNPNVTKNLDGAPAFNYTPELDLILKCASTFMEDSYYASNDEIKMAIKELVNDIGTKNPEFVLKLAAWLRNEMGMRSVSIYLFALMAGHPAYKETKVRTKKGRYVKQGVPKPWLIEYGPYILFRADEVAEVLAAFEAAYPGEKIPQALFKAIVARLEQLSEYEAIKYRAKKRDWSLRDVIKVSHPQPKNEQMNLLFNWIVNDELGPFAARKAGLNTLGNYLEINSANDFKSLEVEDLRGATWEFLTAKFGSTPEVWEAAAQVMPSMAYIRNLRNLLTKSSVSIDTEKIVNAGKGKKILPFRFLSAKNALDSMPYELNPEWKKAKKALHQAMELAVSNVPNLGNVAILLDKSGSMSDPVAGRTDIMRHDVATVFGAAAFKKANNAVIIEYNTNAEVVKGIEQDDKLFHIIEKMGRVGGGTSLGKALEATKPYLKDIDLIYILTDEQSQTPVYKTSTYRSGYYTRTQTEAQYAADVMKEIFQSKPSMRVVNHNLASYGTTELPEDYRVLDIGGWSDQIFKVVLSWRTNNLVDYVKNWSPRRGEEENEE